MTALLFPPVLGTEHLEHLIDLIIFNLRACYLISIARTTRPLAAWTIRHCEDLWMLLSTTTVSRF